MKPAKALPPAPITAPGIHVMLRSGREVVAIFSTDELRDAAYLEFRSMFVPGVWLDLNDGMMVSTDEIAAVWKGPA